METRTLLVAYLGAWLLYLVGVHGYARWRCLSQAAAGLSHAAPSFVAISILWSMWVGLSGELWPLLFLGTLGAGVAQAVWIMVVSVKREWRAWIPVALFGTAMCSFSFVIVIYNCPNA